MRLCPHHHRRLTVRRIGPWRFLQCPQTGCEYSRSLKRERTSKRALGEHTRAAQAPDKASGRTSYGSATANVGSLGTAGKQQRGGTANGQC